MPKESPYGNLTAILVVVALLDLVFERLLGRLFMSPGCAGGLACTWARMAPFFLNLTGLLALMVGAGGVVGHLRRGELFPRGVRFTVAGLSLIFWLLVVLSLTFGRMPERYQFMLEASFGFVIALLILSFLGSHAASTRTRLGFLLFALPTLLHVVALLMARRHGPLNPGRLASLGELSLLAAAMAAPLLLLPRGVPRARWAAGLAMAAGLGAFFSVAYLARTDLLQTVVLYTVQLELPRATTLLGGTYILALLGFVTAAAVLLLSPGPARLSGLGICLMGSAGYQTSSPVALSLSMCGLVALSTGTLRAGGLSQRAEAVRVGTGARVARSKDGVLSPVGWRALLEAIAAGLSGAPRQPGSINTVAEPVRRTPYGDTPSPEPARDDGPGVEVVPAGTATNGPASEIGIVRASRGGRPVVVRLSRASAAAVHAVEVTLGTPPDAAADATIESHETWMGRAPEERPAQPRMKTGDLGFDRVLGVYGQAPLEDRSLRRRLLRLDTGTITMWRSQGAARFVAQATAERPLSGFGGAAAPAVRAVGEIVDVLAELVDAAKPAPPDAVG